MEREQTYTEGETGWWRSGPPMEGSVPVQTHANFNRIDSTEDSNKIPTIHDSIKYSSTSPTQWLMNILDPNHERSETSILSTSDANLLIPRSCVICRPARASFHSLEGTENRTRHNRRTFTISSRHPTLDPTPAHRSPGHSIQSEQYHANSDGRKSSSDERIMRQKWVYHLT